MLKISRAVIAFVLVSAFGPALAAQGAASATPTAPRPRLLGVYDASSGLPIQDVEVTDVFNDVTVRTSASGLVGLGFLPEGRSMVSVRKLGFSAETLFVSISPRDTASITVVLNQVTTLSTVVITDSTPQHTSSNLKAFEVRRKTMLGHFVTEAQLRKDDGLKLSQELGKIPGLVLTTRGDIRSARGGCAPPVFLDGLRLSTGKGMAPLANWDVSDMGAIEYYTIGNVPAQFNQTGTAACGAILIWTRER